MIWALLAPGVIVALRGGLGRGGGAALLAGCGLWIGAMAVV